MADRYINLKELLPLYLQAYKELAAPMDAETPEFQIIEAEHNRIIANRYIVTCDEEGIVRYEQLMGIQPKADDTLEDRIFRCITKWNVCLPYNYAFLDQKLRELCGAEYTLDLDIAGQTVTVKVGLAQKNQYDVVAEMLEEIVPCNLQLNLSLLYNQYQALKPYPHIILAQFTHWELRNLSIPRNLSHAEDNIAAYTVESERRYEMKLTDLFKFKLFERKDVADLAVVNENFQTAESEIDKRLLKTAVQNTNTVTEAGYALDARQANPNVKGSLAELIAALSEMLTSHKSSGDHDSRYYTKTDMNTMLARKADSEHNHDKVYYTKAFVDGLLALKADLTHYHDNRYYTEAETDARMAKAARYVGLYEQEITLAAGGEFYQAIPSTYQNGGYIYFINCSGNSLNFTANMEGYNMAVKNRGASTLATRVQVYFFSIGV